MTTQDKLCQMYDQYKLDSDNSQENYLNFLDEVLLRFPQWTKGEAYIATDFLFRSENMN